MTFTVERIEHRDGVEWWAAPAPPRRHAHRWQTRAWMTGAVPYLERCACGAANEHELLPDWFMMCNDEPRVDPDEERQWWRRIADDVSRRLNARAS